ncbi:MAG: hypothetical protein ACJ77E_10475 [Gaiellaceae bacterium]
MTDATITRPTARDRSALDRFLAAIPVATAALIILMVLFWEAAVRKTPTIFVDELKWAQLSRAIAETGRAAQRGEPASFKSLYAVLIAPCWWLGSTGAAYTAIKYLNLVVMACAAIPVGLLARRLVSPRAGVVAGLLTLCTSAFFYATFLLPEVLAFPTFCLCAYLCVRALAGDGRRWTVAAVVTCAVAALLVRSQLVCAGAAFAVAAAALWLTAPPQRRAWSRWSLFDRAGAVVLGLGGLILLNALVSHHSTEWAVVTQSYKGRMWHLALEAGSALTIGLGVLPVLAGLASLWLPERKDDPVWRAFAAFTAASIVTFGAYTGIKAAYLSVTFGTFAEERNLIYLSPLLIVGAVVYFSARRPSPVALAISTVVCAWLVIAYGYQLGYPYFEAPGYGIAVMANRAFAWDQPTIRLALWGALAVAVLFCLIPFARGRLGGARTALLGLAALGVAVWGLAGEVTSARGAAQGARQLASNLPQPFDWVDQATGGSGVTYLGQQVGNDIGLALTEFWNRSIKHIWTLDGTAPGPGPTLTPDLAKTDGTLRVDPGLDYVLADNGVKLIGRPLQTNGSLTLVRVTHPWRLQETYYGRAPDGWVADQHDATYAYFGPLERGVLTVDVSRQGFCAASAPPTPVTIGIGPVGLNSQRAAVVARATTVRHALLRSCRHVPIRLETTAPVAVSVHVANLVRASDYGISDSRELAAQFSASFTPTR